MAKKKEIIGKCQLCGLRKKLTFEHVPPKAAFNSDAIFIQKYDHLLNELSPVYGKKMRSNKGFGAYTLCKECNNNTGSWYAKDFAEFALQGMDILKYERENLEKVKFVIQFKPLNVVKQILTMFLSADTSGSILKVPKLQKFLLDKKSRNFPKNIKILMYCNCSVNKKMIGYSIGLFPNFEGVCSLSEINFKPFGYILVIGEAKSWIPYGNATPFLNFAYNEVQNVEMELPYLKVGTSIIGQYVK